ERFPDLAFRQIAQPAPNLPGMQPALYNRNQSGGYPVQCQRSPSARQLPPENRPPPPRQKLWYFSPHDRTATPTTQPRAPATKPAGPPKLWLVRYYDRPAPVESPWAAYRSTVARWPPR